MMRKLLWLWPAILIVTAGCSTVGTVHEPRYPAVVETTDKGYVVLPYEFVFDYQPPGVTADSEWSRLLLQAMVENMAIALESRIRVLLSQIGADYSYDELLEFSTGPTSTNALARRVQERVHDDPDYEGVTIHRLEYEIERSVDRGIAEVMRGGSVPTATVILRSAKCLLSTTNFKPTGAFRVFERIPGADASWIRRNRDDHGRRV